MMVDLGFGNFAIGILLQTWLTVSAL